MAPTAHTDATDLTYDEIRRYAERIGRRHEIYDEQGCADLDYLLNRLGGVVEVHDSNESLKVRGKGDFTVYIPSTTSPRRDRFTIAHEIAHYFLHYRYPKLSGEQAYWRGGRSVAETEANVFAASLLMPEDSFTEAYSALDGDLWRLASRFEVSPAAAEVRAATLRLPGRS